MNAKLSIIKISICFLFACPLMGHAQEATDTSIAPHQINQDTIVIIKHDTVWMEKEKVKIDSADIDKRSSRYDRRLHRHRQTAIKSP